MICTVKDKCGGCSFQGIEYAEQLKKKQEDIQKLLGKFGKVSPILGMENPCNYRNKVHHAFGTDRKGNVISGSYAEGTHRIIQTDQCMLEDAKSQEIIRTVRSMLKSFKIQVYEEDKGYGLLRHVLVRRGFSTGEIMVVLITASPVFPSKNNFVKALRQKHPEITTVVQNINDRKTSMVLGQRSVTLYGPGFIKDTLCGLSFRISPDSFYQVNPVQTERLYSTAIDFAGLTGKETVIDAYCGIGTIGLCASKYAGKVIGVELNRNAVGDAILNCKANKISNARFYQGDAGDFMSQMAARKEKADVVFMDPPRSGSTEKFMASAVRLGPSRIVYVSCGPDTLARDLKFLTSKGYRVEKIQPVDMFPFTGHVETVVLLSKLCPEERRIPVTIELSEVDISAREKKATYPQIKEWVMNHYNLKVSSLYIAQVKEKYGIKEAENYNVGKEGHRVPKCPPDKEKAITAALKNFEMID
ncbi:MAG: 23S rRNA (uracil(1939)-C(5))-methyltransferase RlmD [Clostridia bacterium]|nr:23S rRNA (uracil(1939)-C(5))-methyltransferase RlmD [Clostridia bacterium]